MNGKTSKIGSKIIDSYDFGIITVNGKPYRRDLVIFPDHIKDNWWRREGHNLHISDIKDILGEKPEVLIVGTGHSGLMKVSIEVKDHLKSQNITLITQSTKEACNTYNKLSKSKKVVAALHLTC